ncbi:MAG: prepilin-type N-terminal cleavage/methylation domain-containing protein [Lachnospiraceae bacterium]|nr:prepilin-type N-terminal cleavage/methylation domain-containing protein [Lachnospiraceae bacterium]
MARKNNKGFSIVEIVIAITILSVLLVPIVTQISQTLRTSRLTKRQQLANDNAIYLMEDFQKSSMDELKTAYGEPNKQTKTCAVYDTSGDYKADVSYTVWIYSPAAVSLGHENTVYNRTVVMDDLATSLLAEGYKLSVNSVSLDGFEINNEGNTIKTDANGIITDAVCDSATIIADPNKINLGNMQNMDSSKVAIIGGNATNFDAQADSEFFSIMMNRMKLDAYSTWNQALYHVQGDAYTNQAYNFDKIRKITRIYIDEGVDAGNHYYQVSADVVYQYENPTSGEVLVIIPEDERRLRFNVYSQRFYTDKCPDVYMEYQPFTADSTEAGFEYTSNDYLIVESYVEDAKIYLYKPFNDQMNTRIHVSGLVSGAAGSEEKYKFYTTGAATTAVNIHLNSERDTKSVKVYTNIDTTTFDLSKYNVFSQLYQAQNTSNSSFNDAFIGTCEPLSADQRLQERLFTIRVSLKADDNSDANDVSLTGVKGEN